MALAEILSSIYSLNRYIEAYVWLGVPEVVQGIIVAFVFAMVFRKYIKKYPYVFYAYPIFLVAWYLFRFIVNNLYAREITREWWIMNSWISQLGGIPSSLGLFASFGIGMITLVMFIGVLPKSKIVIELMKIRAELAIIGTPFLIAHGLARFGNATRFYNAETLDIHMQMISFAIIGPIILVLLVLPWITSFPVIRKKMNPKLWKKIQIYTCIPMFIGMLLFGVLMTYVWSFGAYPGIDLLNLREIVTSSNGRAISLSSGISFAGNVLAYKIYLVLLGAYIYLRYKRANDRKKKNAPKAE